MVQKIKRGWNTTTMMFRLFLAGMILTTGMVGYANAGYLEHECKNLLSEAKADHIVATWRDLALRIALVIAEDRAGDLFVVFNDCVDDECLTQAQEDTFVVWEQNAANELAAWDQDMDATLDDLWGYFPHEGPADCLACSASCLIIANVPLGCPSYGKRGAQWHHDQGEWDDCGIRATKANDALDDTDAHMDSADQNEADADFWMDLMSAFLLENCGLNCDDD